MIDHEGNQFTRRELSPKDKEDLRKLKLLVLVAALTGPDALQGSKREETIDDLATSLREITGTTYTPTSDDLN